MFSRGNEGLGGVLGRWRSFPHTSPRRNPHLAHIRQNHTTSTLLPAASLPPRYTVDDFQAASGGCLFSFGNLSIGALSGQISAPSVLAMFIDSYSLASRSDVRDAPSSLSKFHFSFPSTHTSPGMRRLRPFFAFPCCSLLFLPLLSFLLPAAAEEAPLCGASPAFLWGGRENYFGGREEYAFSRWGTGRAS